MKRTYQPSKVKRERTHGFLVRMRTKGGRSVIASRRAKGRVRLGIQFILQNKLLKLQTYFTAGVKEVRAWTITKGTKAPQAAAVIHTDFEKGFIRAEVMAYDDFVSLGSEQACRDAGKLSVEGKDYVVKDGDIMHFRFNVQSSSFLLTLNSFL